MFGQIFFSWTTFENQIIFHWPRLQIPLSCLVTIFSCRATQYMVLCVRMSADVLPVSGVRSRFTKLYSPNLCLGKSIVGNVVVWFVCFMSWSGIPHSFQKILLLWLKTTGLALHTKCQSVCLSMSFILRNFSDQSRHFLSTSGKLPRLKFCFPHILA